jgi:hypothetical protein
VAEHVGRVADAGFRRFYFVDNTFNLPPSYALELCRCLESTVTAQDSQAPRAFR